MASIRSVNFLVLVDMMHFAATVRARKCDQSIKTTPLADLNSPELEHTSSTFIQKRMM
jgi:hypothetical protein